MIVMPFRDITGDTPRVEALAYLQALYEEWFPDWTLAPSDTLWPEPWSRVKQLNQLIRACDDDAVIVYSDPGSFAPDPDRYREAARIAAAAPGLVVPFERALYLTEETSRRVIHEGLQPPPAGQFSSVFNCDEVVYGGHGNLVVFSRETWEAAGRFDERFPLYGGDDAAFAICCAALVAPTRRLAGDVLHLWHPRLQASIPGTHEHAAQFAILAEYRDANIVGPEAVRALVESR